MSDEIRNLLTVIQREPHRADLRHALGNLLRGQGRIQEAAVAYGEAARLAPHVPEFFNDLGNLHLQLGRLAEAEACYRRALELRPAYPQAQRNLAILLRRFQRWAELESWQRRVLEHQPENAEAHFQLGIALKEQKRFVEAQAALQRALALKADDPVVHNVLGTNYWAQGEWARAEACFREALRLDPAFAKVLSNLGLALQIRNRPLDAEDCYRRAIALEPEYDQAHYNLAMLLLLQGRFTEGWPEHEWRVKPPLNPELFPQPSWDGRPLRGEWVLLHTEQGRGDTMQFVRYAAFVKQRGGKVLLGCPKDLIPLLSTSPDVDRICPGRPLPPFDLQLPLLSLPLFAGTVVHTIPNSVPYLFADERLEHRWRERLRAYPGFKIGIAWQGDTSFAFDRLRSIPLAEFAPLAELDGVHLFSLQHGAGTEQLAAWGSRFEIVNLGAQLDRETGAFQDTAAAMKNLDLVITSDTAIAHLAGALAVPTWVALSHVPNWRWLLDREDSPWYPTMRLFRQSSPGDWSGVFQRMALELKSRLAGSNRRAPLCVEVSAGELLDKLTILEIKSRRIHDPAKLGNIRKELAALAGVCAERNLTGADEARQLVDELRTINEELWTTEDALRACERTGAFGNRFIELARSVYRLNDRRSDLKRRLNILLGSALVEEKAYGADGQG